MKIISGLIFFAATLTIYGEYFDRRLLYFFKPLALVLIITLAWFYKFASTQTSKFYRTAILSGLVFSLGGDIFLIDPKQYFVFGLASFLIAHLCYIAAFSRAAEGKFNPLSVSAFLIGAVMLWTVYAGVPAGLKVPVIVYALAISAMLAAALNFYLMRNAPQAMFALSGAFLFIVSDSVLAYNKFNTEFYLAKLILLSTYFLAQWLIARSV